MTQPILLDARHGSGYHPLYAVLFHSRSLAQDYNKPLIIPAGSDSLATINMSEDLTFDAWRHVFTARFPQVRPSLLTAFSKIQCTLYYHSVLLYFTMDCHHFYYHSVPLSTTVSTASQYHSVKHHHSSSLAYFANFPLHFHHADGTLCFKSNCPLRNK